MDDAQVSTLDLTATQTAHRVVLDLDGAVVLLLHFLDDTRGPARGETLGCLYRSDAIQVVRETILGYAPSSAPVLIRGETGTGEELVARAARGASARGGAAYVVANAAEDSPPHADVARCTAHHCIWLPPLRAIYSHAERHGRSGCDGARTAGFGDGAAVCSGS